jgi:hypothetical protein
MNFLSHYYFDRADKDANVVMGTVLPDLIKNAAKEANLYPQKNEFLFKGNPDEEKSVNWLEKTFGSRSVLPLL